MCGIAGIIDFKLGPVTEKNLVSFSSAIKHRGPDADGYQLFANGQVGFAHKRLSILDLSNEANQPMQSKNGRYTLVFNGEVFNFLEIKKDLESLGRKFTTVSDTEVVLEAYDQWGNEAFHKFNGMWALAIFDKKNQEVILCRDRFGIKPLFYVKNSQQFAFASETNCFRNLREYNRSINFSVLKHSVNNPYYASANNVSVFNNIVSLPAGHCMIIRLNGESETEQWYKLQKRCAENPQSYEPGKFRELFLDAVKIRLRSDVGIGTAFSGGMDSSAVFSSIKHLANNSQESLKRLPKNWQTAFTVAVAEDSELDDWPYAKKALAELNANYVKLEKQASQNLLEELKISCEKADCILGTPLNVISQIYGSMKEHGLSVSMDGHGADEYLYGYRGMVNDLFYNSLQRKGKKQSKRIAKALAPLYPKSQVFSKQKQLLNEIHKSYGGINYFKRLYRNTFNPVNITQDIVNKNLLYSPLPALLHSFDKASMLHSIEIRMPFMDYRLIEYCHGLQNKYFVNEGFTKWILRNELEDILPKAVLERKNKIGISAPVNHWLDSVNQKHLKEIVNDGPQSDTLKELGGDNPSNWFKFNLQALQV
jgi:asparagine synthase (glutamine-hydrolysing)